MPMKLFTFATSPYARKVRMVLELKKIDFDPVERCYSLDRKDDLLSASARAEVPALDLGDGRTISDSTIICEYLEEMFPAAPLFPAEPFQRARMRMIEDLCDRSFDAAGFCFWLGELRKDAPESPAIKRAAADELRQLLAVLERELGESNFFCGEMSLADLAAIF